MAAVLQKQGISSSDVCTWLVLRAWLAVCPLTCCCCAGHRAAGQGSSSARSDYSSSPAQPAAASVDSGSRSVLASTAPGSGQQGVKSRSNLSSANNQHALGAVASAAKSITNRTPLRPSAADPGWDDSIIVSNTAGLAVLLSPAAAGAGSAGSGAAGGGPAAGQLSSSSQPVLSSSGADGSAAKPAGKPVHIRVPSYLAGVMLFGDGVIRLPCNHSTESGWQQH